MKRILVLIAVLGLWSLPLVAGEFLMNDSGDTAPTLILHNGIVVPMTEESVYYEAIAVAGDRILALGSDEETLALAGPNSEIVDLKGATVLPGFIDPHTHIFTTTQFPDPSWAPYGIELMSLDEAQQIFIENGVTVAAESNYTPWAHENCGCIQYAEEGNMRMTVFLYFEAAECCCTYESDGVTIEPGDILNDYWYEAYAPRSELAPRLFMGGIKIFEERSGNCPYMTNSFSPALLETLPVPAFERYGDSDAMLMFTEEELTALIQRAQDKGYQVAIHTTGDRSIETCLNAIETVLDGEENTLRHLLYHNYFLRDDLIPRYSELGVVAVCESVDDCLVRGIEASFGPELAPLFRRWGDLAASGAMMASNSDWPPVHPLSPIDRLVELTTGENTSPFDAGTEGCPEYSAQTVSTWQALKMLTCNAAFALRIEDDYGTLVPGKRADLALLNANPLEMDPSGFEAIAVAATYIDGRLEYSDGSIVRTYGFAEAMTEQLTIRILFDEGHNEKYTISASRALQINEANPGYAYYGWLADGLGGLIPAPQRQEQPLDAEALESYDVVVIAGPRTDLSVAERRAIEQYVEGGGGLLVLGSTSSSAVLNDLLTSFDLAFAACRVLSASYSFRPESFVTTLITAGTPVTEGVASLCVEYAVPLLSTGGALIVAQTGADCWLDVDYNRELDTSEQVGSLPLAVVKQQGSGRIAATSSNCLVEGVIDRDDNRQFILNLIKWLAGD